MMNFFEHFKIFTKDFLQASEKISCNNLVRQSKNKYKNKKF